MALTFPRDLPSYVLVRGTFTLVDAVASSASRSGAKLNLTRVSDPTWTLDVETPPLRPHEKRAWTAWKNSLRGGLREFLAYDITRNPPAAYPKAKTPQDISPGWGGTAAVSSLGLAGALGLSNLPAGYQVRVGDRIGLEAAAGHRGYYEAVEDAVANASGALTVTVSPFLHTSLFTTSAIARLWLPKAKFIIDWQSWQQETIGEPTPIAFRAVQRVMA